VGPFSSRRVLAILQGRSLPRAFAINVVSSALDFPERERERERGTRVVISAAGRVAIFFRDAIPLIPPLPPTGGSRAPASWAQLGNRRNRIRLFRFLRKHDEFQLQSGYPARRGGRARSQTRSQCRATIIQLAQLGLRKQTAEKRREQRTGINNNEKKSIERIPREGRSPNEMCPNSRLSFLSFFYSDGNRDSARGSAKGKTVSLITRRRSYGGVNRVHATPPTVSAFQSDSDTVTVTDALPPPGAPTVSPVRRGVGRRTPVWANPHRSQPFSSPARARTRGTCRGAFPQSRHDELRFPDSSSVRRRPRRCRFPRYVVAGQYLLDNVNNPALTLDASRSLYSRCASYVFRSDMCVVTGRLTSRVIDENRCFPSTGRGAEKFITRTIRRAPSYRSHVSMAEDVHVRDVIRWTSARSRVNPRVSGLFGKAR